MSNRVLKQWAEKDNSSWKTEYGYSGNCSCHLSPPCSSCTHPGNPLNQECDEDCWTWETEDDMLDELESEARSSVMRLIDNIVARHRSEMKSRPSLKFIPTNQATGAKALSGRTKQTVADAAAERKT